MSMKRRELVESTFSSMRKFLSSLEPQNLARDSGFHTWAMWSNKYGLPLGGGASESVIPTGYNEEEQRAAMRACCIAMPELVMKQMPETLLQLWDRLLAEELSLATVVEALALPQLAPKVTIWQGDMSILKADAVVNPANSVLLGCFLPTHKCLDNILHGASGPRLRIACQEMKDELKIDNDANGMCRVTEAFSLPSKKVFHTCGPNLGEYYGHPRRPTDLDRQELTSSYLLCLDTASQMKLDSLAFCCISTGVFGYPSDEAAQVAMGTTKEWMVKAEAEGRHIPLVVFNVFLDKDLAVYHKNFPLVFGDVAGASQGKKVA